MVLSAPSIVSLVVILVSSRFLKLLIYQSLWDKYKSSKYRVWWTKQYLKLYWSNSFCFCYKFRSLCPFHCNMFVGNVWLTLYRFLLFLFFLWRSIPFALIYFMKWIMVFISLLIIMMIGCTCCHLYCLGFYALPSPKNTVICFVMPLAGHCF